MRFYQISNDPGKVVMDNGHDEQGIKVINMGNTIQAQKNSWKNLRILCDEALAKIEKIEKTQ